MNNSRKRARRRQRPLKLQALETRQLLAAEFGDGHNADMPEDVNADGIVSSVDALMVINRLAGRRQNTADAPPAFRDVNADGNVSSLDALRVINRMQRQNRGDDSRGDAPPRDPNQPPPPTAEDASAEVRSIDGTGNNLDDPLLGSAGTEFRRLADPDYADGVAEPSGADRPSAREISNILAAQEGSIPNAQGLSDLVWQWGQFIDHDIDLTAEGDGEAFNIEVPAGDPFFDPAATGEQEIGLTRSGIAEGTGVDSPAQQVNEITAFIDGSMVYGSSEETAASLRSFEGGRLRTSENDLLPLDESGFFMAGDVRANEQQGLTAMQTLWVREHNRVADEIAASDSSLSDEQIYQQARAIVIGEIQAITFQEYLPTLLGRDAIERYKGYDSTVDPTISNLFATAAFRYGHTALSSELKRLDDEGNVIEEGNILLRDAFFNPTDILELGIDPLLKGLASNVSQEIDTQLVDDVRNFLFGPPGSGGFDLASLNIQRGRDHGLPDYNSAREQLGLERARTFADISSDPEVQAKLQEAYGNVDNIDVWVGALAEDHVPGASVGELTRTVLVEQFTALRDGDRFWYQNTFEGEQLREIERTRLSDVIERNTELTSIQDNAFVVPDAAQDRQVRPDQPDQPLPPPPGDSPQDGPTNGQSNPPPPPPLPTQPPATPIDGGGGQTDPPPPPPPQRGGADGGQRQSQRQRQDGVTGLDMIAVDQVLAETRFA